MFRREQSHNLEIQISQDIDGMAAVGRNRGGVHHQAEALALEDLSLACGQTLETYLDDELIRFLLLRRLECRATFLRFRCRACG
jgi:hypothetical protein